VKTILLADDSITIQKVVELTFSEADYRVVCVSSGGQALKKMAEVRPDVVLLDVIMPEKNGYDVCEQLKRNPATSGIPVLLLTGTFEPFDRKRAEAAGANGHITKPFESQVLVSKVEELIAATPSVSADDEGGRMDIISGGEVYRVDPGRAGEGMRPASPTGSGFQTIEPHAAAQTPAAVGSGPMPTPHGPSIEDEGSERETQPHPALGPPDPASGGSFVGFGDVGLEAGMEGMIVPDRFDDVMGPSSPSTVKLRREGVAPRREEVSAGSAPHAGVASGTPASETAFSGSFEAEFDLVDEEPEALVVPTGRQGEDEGTGGWVPPPEAPPAETWQTADEPAESPPPETVRPGLPDPMTEAGAAAGVFHPEPAGDGKTVPLTPEMIDLIAEKVVERLADRVVREVAWEVVPGVAEALVRKRIKELEESGS
jgi:CheY-like chemotaxis protein